MVKSRSGETTYPEGNRLEKRSDPPLGQRHAQWSAARALRWSRSPPRPSLKFQTFHVTQVTSVSHKHKRYRPLDTSPLRSFLHRTSSSTGEYDA